MIPSSIRTFLTAALVAAALAGCGDRPPPSPRMSEVLPNLPLPPRAQFVARSGGEEALQVTVRSPLPASNIESYYRTTLTQGGWRLVNQARDSDGALVLLAEQDGPPLWVRIRPAEDTSATLVEFSGARLAGAPKPAS